SVGPLLTLPARIVPLSVPHPSLPALTVQARRNTTPSFKPCFTPLHTDFSEFPEFYFQLSHFASPLTAPVQLSRRFPFRPRNTTRLFSDSSAKTHQKPFCFTLFNFQYSHHSLFSSFCGHGRTDSKVEGSLAI